MGFKYMGDIVIYILTYDHPHRKTQDLVFRLMCTIITHPSVTWIEVVNNYLILVILPWEDRKNHKPLYNTKLPPSLIWPQQYGLEEWSINQIPPGSTVVIGGAGILPPDFVKNNTVINSHCGWLPEVRGLDALKWAIYYDSPIGCTTHIVDAECDKGLLIERKEVELEPTDSLFSIAMKQYELEINMLVDCIVNGSWKDAQPFVEPSTTPNRRMKHATELQMMKRLETRLTGLSDLGSK